MLLSEVTLAGARFGGGRPERFREELETLLELLPQGQSVESTLRCTMVHEGAATETLFGVVGGRLRPVSRQRPLREKDHVRAPSHGQIAALQGLGPGRMIAVLVLLLVGFGLGAWQTGYIDQLFAPGVERLGTELGDFDGLVRLDIEKSWGVYKLELRRGARFPAKSSEVEALLAERESTKAQAAVRLVADGSRIWVQLRDADGKVLHAGSAALRPLLEEPDAVVKLSLKGRIGVREIRLALSSGTAARDTKNETSESEGGK